MSKLVICSELKKYYGKSTITKALDGVDLSIEKCEFVAIMGPSGSGKSTLLNLLATIDQPTSGRIIIDGEDITHASEKESSRFRRDKLGFIFQDFNLLDTLTARENIALALSIVGKSKAEIDKKTKEVAKTLNIEKSLDKYPYQLSGGQRQRVATARAIVREPSLLLGDEPTGNLDSKSARILLESFKELHEMGNTLVMVTHDAFAASFASRVCFLSDGHLVDMMENYGSQQEFLDQLLKKISQIGGINHE